MINFGTGAKMLIESVGVSNAIRTPKDCDLINIAFEETTHLVGETDDYEEDEIEKIIKECKLTEGKLD